MALNIDNVIEVTIQQISSGLAIPNVNILNLFTTEIPGNLDAYRIYRGARDVATDYGTNSTTYAMANAIFSQVPNILTGGGYLVITPMINAVDAASAYFTSANISANLASLIGVSNGSLKIILDGTTIQLTNLDFTDALTFADISDILQDELPNAIIAPIANTGITITSKEVGLTNSSISFATSPSGTDLIGASYLNTAAGVITPGVDEGGESLIAAINRITPQVAFSGIITNLEMNNADILINAQAIQATQYIWFQHFVSKSDIAGICTDIQDAGLTRTRCLLYTTNIIQANLMKSAYAGRALSVNFSGSNTSQTMNLKALAGILPDTGITQTDYTNANTAGTDLYVPYGSAGNSAGYVYSTGGNDFFDNVYNITWLKGALQIAGFNYLATINTKIPQTEDGMSGLKHAYELILIQAIQVGIIGQGLTWNSGEFFGNQADFLRNITDVGYYIYSQPISQQNQPDRTARKAPLVQIAFIFAGAIHTSMVNVLIES